jgi:hypothetical protein
MKMLDVRESKVSLKVFMQSTFIIIIRSSLHLNRIYD